MGYYDDFQRFRNVFDSTNNKYPTRVINGNQILEQDKNGDMIQIGWTKEYCDEVEEIANDAINKAEQYKQILIDHGIIEKEKTPEEIAKEQVEKQEKLIQEQFQSMEKMMSLINKLEAKIDNGGVIDECRGNVDISKETKPETSETNRAKSAKNKSSGGIMEQISKD